MTFGGALAGCVKGSTGSNANAVCYVSVLNAAPYSSATDIYFNGTKVSPSGGISPGQFSSEYGSLKPGTYTVDFKVAGSDSVLDELPATPYDTSNFYTLIFYNTAPKSPAVSAARILDDFSAVTETSSYYRFFNLNPDMPSVDLYLNGTASQVNRTPADNISNPMYNQFTAISATTYSLQVKDSKTDSVLATSNEFPLSGGSVYTIFLQGTSASANIVVLPALY